MGSLGLLLLVSAVLGYLFGSVPFGLLLTKAAGLGDVRTIGSGNIGATNVLRTGHKGIAALTLAGDLLKGTAAVLVATLVATHLFHVSPSVGFLAGVVAGFAAFVGHLYPVWLGFAGGKGVATYIGVLLGISPPLAVLFCGIWLLVAFASRTSSLAALIASLAMPILVLLLPRFGFALYPPSILFLVLLAMTTMLIWKHRENIARIRRGEETKIGQKG